MTKQTKYISGSETYYDRLSEAAKASTDLNSPTATEVHRVMHFIVFGSDKVRKVLYCPKCKMPNFTGSYYTESVNCETCFTLYMFPEKMLESAKPEDYIRILREIPLKYRGKLFADGEEPQETKQLRKVTYNDLPVPVKLELDKICNI